MTPKYCRTQQNDPHTRAIRGGPLIADASLITLAAAVADDLAHHFIFEGFFGTSDRQEQHQRAGSHGHCGTRTSAPAHVANGLGARTKYSVALTTTSVPDACGYVRVVEVHNNVSQHTVTKLEAELKAAQDCGTEINTDLCTCTPKVTPDRHGEGGRASQGRRGRGGAL